MRPEFFYRSGTRLVEVYIFTGGHYRLLKSYYGLEGN
jgi:hypothetical protein